ncbi:MAG TPA: molybdopterin molybdotransferase MoeA [Methanospirillum sp.]|jgi:molybdopterin molybdotransferase|uniref:molybdopterin molybdotransferase MoeA n=1 Tax=Methanospirillum sp. TaxID=45200 RepID=UPI0009CB1BDB|nr:gephyrin-like molybdotransferase Glp [Methanospirillum sp.]OQB39159.1 MAG: molybdopterin biosynthesis protein MoeA [Euryarchaeota archaeon ADurb.Bin165]HPY60939.1 molybdopterin molybdotransferase MoeA [Methanospirillum sp.]HQC00153.1 molybdopterin molybdotransferase MoeA [Methanospirillum sp.]
MSRFLSVIPVEKARSVLLGMARKTGEKRVPLIGSAGYVLRTDIISDVDIPGFDRSAVDGYALVAADTVGAGESIPAMLRLSGSIDMGGVSKDRVLPGTCMYIPTGAFLPPGADAVVMIEYCEVMDDEVLISKPAAVGENIVYKGEDFSTKRPAIQAGTKINSRVMGVLAACGVEDVLVSEKPRIAIISTGNEIVPVTEVPGPGQVRDVNTYLIAGFIQESGGIPVIIGIVQDERRLLEEALDKAVSEADIVLISGGSSKGERDMCADIIGSHGELLVHGIALSPGKPTIIGQVKNKPVIGLPGHPASAYVVLHALVRDLVHAITGEISFPVRQSGVLTSPVPSAKGREDYVRVIKKDDDITPLFGKSGLTNTLVNSDGLLCIPADTEGYEKGTRVFIDHWRNA